MNPNPINERLSIPPNSEIHISHDLKITDEKQLLADKSITMEIRTPEGGIIALTGQPVEVQIEGIDMDGRVMYTETNEKDINADKFVESARIKTTTGLEQYGLPSGVDARIFDAIDEHEAMLGQEQADIFEENLKETFAFARNDRLVPDSITIRDKNDKIISQSADIDYAKAERAVRRDFLKHVNTYLKDANNPESLQDDADKSLEGQVFYTVFQKDGTFKSDVAPQAEIDALDKDTQARIVAAADFKKALRASISNGLETTVPVTVKEEMITPLSDEYFVEIKKASQLKGTDGVVAAIDRGQPKARTFTDIQKPELDSVHVLSLVTEDTLDAPLANQFYKRSRNTRMLDVSDSLEQGELTSMLKGHIDFAIRESAREGKPLLIDVSQEAADIRELVKKVVIENETPNQLVGVVNSNSDTKKLFDGIKAHNKDDFMVTVARGAINIMEEDRRLAKKQELDNENTLQNSNNSPRPRP